MNLIEQWLKAGNRILVAPGWNNSPAEHWQSLWQIQFPMMQRIEQIDWAHPKAADWVSAFENEVAKSTAPTVIVAHSLACATLAHWATLYGRQHNIKAAILVAPADVMRPEAPQEFMGFMPLPQAPLPFTSWMIASDNDPSCSVDRAMQLAQHWRCKLRVLNGVGHINVASGHGEWPEGLQYLVRVVAQLYELDWENVIDEDIVTTE